MGEITPKIEFDILIDETFEKLVSSGIEQDYKNNNVLSLLNDFEDGKWRFNKFQEFIWNNIAETALSYREREALIDKNQTTLIEAAKKLRLIDSQKNQNNQGSELAEIVLYGVMKHHYKALPVVPKIFYKQNSQDNAKGADSVHIVLKGSDDFTIWFGEAKFYNSIEDDRLNEIISSVESSLNTNKIQKENSIITNVSDLDNYLKEDSEISKKIKEFLATEKSIDQLKPKLHIPILLIHECGITYNQKEISEEYKKKLIDFQVNRVSSYFKKQIKKLSKKVFKYSEINFHVILFPVPEKKPIIDKFVENVEHYKKQ